MSLVIEDGSVVAGAQSYASVQNLKDYASLRRLTLPEKTEEMEALLIKAVDYIESFRDKFRGHKKNDDQALQWPREHVYIDNDYFDSGAIPVELIQAQCQLAFDAIGGDLQATGSGQQIIRQKVGPIETEYSDSGSSTVQRRFNKAEAFLKPLLRATFRTVSVTRS
jgi:hypothetical protein